MIHHIKNITLLFFIWLLSAILWAYFLFDPFQGHSEGVSLFIKAASLLLFIIPLTIAYIEREEANLHLQHKMIIDILGRAFSIYIKLLPGLIISYFIIEWLKDNPLLLANFFDDQIALLLKTIGYNAVSENGSVILPGKRVAIDLVKIGFYFNVTQLCLISSFIFSLKIKPLIKIKMALFALFIIYLFTICYGASITLRILPSNYAGADLFKMVYFDGLIYRSLLIIPILFLLFRRDFTLNGSERIAPSFLWREPYYIFFGLAIISLSFLYFFPGKINAGRPNIIFDDIHGKWESTLIKFDEKISGIFAENSYYGFARYLANFYNVTIVTDDNRVLDIENVKTLKREKITDKILSSQKNNTILIIKCPTVKYSDDEVRTIVQFVREGGKLFLIGDHTNVYFMNDNINKISNHFGIKYGEDSIYMVDGGWVISKKREFRRILVTSFLKTLLWATNCHLELQKGAFPIIKSPIASFSEGADYHKQNFFGNGMIDSFEIFGSYTILAGAKFGAGRVVAFTDSTCFNNYLMFTPGRREFLDGIFTWLMSRDIPRMYYSIPILFFIISILLFVKKKGWTQNFLSIYYKIFLIVPISIFLSFCFLYIFEPTVESFEKFEDPKSVVLFDSTRKVLHSIVYGGSESFMLDDSYDDLFYDLPRFGYYPKSLIHGQITKKRLAEGKNLVIISPTEGYTYFERVAIRNFVKDGGSLFLVEGANSNKAINEIASLFSLHLETDINLRFIQSNRTIMRNPCKINGGVPLFTISDMAVISYQDYGNGRVVAICDDRIFTSINKEYSANKMEFFADEIISSASQSGSALLKIDYPKFLNTSYSDANLFLPLEREKQKLPFYRH